MDLNQLMLESMQKIESSGKLQEIIDKHVTESVEKLIEEQLSWRGDLYKNLQEKIGESLAVNLDKLDLPSYNYAILENIRATIEDQVNTKGLPDITAKIENMLSNPPRQYKLSELIKELAEDVEDLTDLDYEETHEMSLHVDTVHSLSFIYFDQRPDIKEYDCKYRLFVTGSGKISSVNIGDDEFTGNTIPQNFTVKQIMNGLTGMDLTLFQMYLNGSTLVVDENKCETELSNPEFE